MSDLFPKNMIYKRFDSRNKDYAIKLLSKIVQEETGLEVESLNPQYPEYTGGNCTAIIFGDRIAKLYYDKGMAKKAYTNSMIMQQAHGIVDSIPNLLHLGRRYPLIVESIVPGRTLRANFGPDLKGATEDQLKAIGNDIGVYMAQMRDFFVKNGDFRNFVHWVSRYANIYDEYERVDFYDQTLAYDGKIHLLNLAPVLTFIQSDFHTANIMFDPKTNKTSFIDFGDMYLDRMSTFVKDKCHSDLRRHVCDGYQSYTGVALDENVAFAKPDTRPVAIEDAEFQQIRDGIFADGGSAFDRFQWGMLDALGAEPPANISLRPLTSEDSLLLPAEMPQLGRPMSLAERCTQSAKEIFGKIGGFGPNQGIRS